MPSIQTYAPEHVGEQIVSMGARIVPCDGENDTCPFCDKQLSVREDSDGPYYLGFEDARGVKWCDENCELLGRLDQRPFYLQRIKDSITFGLDEVAKMYAEQLASFSEAFEQVTESLLQSADYFQRTKGGAQ